MTTIQVAALEYFLVHHSFEYTGYNQKAGTVIYSPPYLFNGPRPVIKNKAPQQVKYGATIQIQTAQADNIQWVSLIKPMATTHSCDVEQRLVDLPINYSDGASVNVTIANNPNLAPPGWYMLFISDNNRIPSVAKWVQIMA